LTNFFQHVTLLTQQQTLEALMSIIVKQTPFHQIPVNSCFYYKGVLWYKRSSRTANVNGYRSRWKRFSKNDMAD